MLTEHVEIVHRRHVVDEPVVCIAQHTALRDFHPGGIGDDRLFERDFGAIGKTRHHLRRLAPRFGKRLLCLRRAITVLKTLNVAAHPRGQPHARHKAIEIDLHPWLIAVAARQHHPGSVGINFEHRAYGAIEFGIHQHHVFATGNRLHGHLSAKFDMPGRFHQDIDLLGLTEQIGIPGDHRLSLPNRVF